MEHIGKVKNTWYVLEGHKPVPAPDLMAGARAFGDADRRVAWTEFEQTEVSTVFLAVDHNFLPSGPPLLFETMVFTTNPRIVDMDNATERYATWEEAEAGHAEMVGRVRARLEGC